jgi:hypothetical protein
LAPAEAPRPISKITQVNRKRGHTPDPFCLPYSG